MEANSTEQILEYWEKIADWYEHYGPVVTTQLFYGFIHTLKLDQCQKILETGCGPGNGTPIIQQYAHPQAEIVGTDLSPAQIAKAQSQGHQRSSFLVANSEELPFEDNQFDAYIANMSLMIVTHPERMLAEAYRVTKPGAISAFTVWGTQERCTYLSILFDTVQEYSTEPQARSNFHLNDRDQLRQLVLRAGYRQVFVYPYDTPVIWTTTDELLPVYDGHPKAAALKSRPDYQEILDSMRTRIEAIFNSGSTVNIGVFVCLAIK